MGYNKDENACMKKKTDASTTYAHFATKKMMTKCFQQHNFLRNIKAIYKNTLLHLFFVSI
jgi:hypothetical protein